MLGRIPENCYSLAECIYCRDYSNLKYYLIWIEGKRLSKPSQVEPLTVTIKNLGFETVNTFDRTIRGKKSKSLANKDLFQSHS